MRRPEAVTWLFDIGNTLGELGVWALLSVCVLTATSIPGSGW